MDCNTFQHANLWTHVHEVKHNETEYMKELATHMDSLSPAVKGTRFAALHLTGKHKALNSTVKYWDIASLYKMLTYLDTPRQVKQLTKKIQTIESQHPHLIQVEDENTMAESNSSKRKNETKDEKETPTKKRHRKIDGLRTKLKKLQGDLEDTLSKNHSNNDAVVDSSISELIESASVSGSLARKIRTLWAPTLKADYLEFVMLEMPKKTVWQYVADLVHFKPTDFRVSYFLADIFDEAIPEDGFVFVMRKLMEASDKELVDSFKNVAASFPQIYKSYAYLRNKDRLICSKEIVKLLAENIPVETAIWYFEELYRVSNAVPTILVRRMEEDDFLLTVRRNESKVFTFGKLLERLLTFQKFHQKKLASLLMGVAAIKLDLLKEKYRDNLNPKSVAVFGDASSSMTTAIEAAAIIASIISTTLDGELSFFTGKLLKSPHQKPSSVEETLEVCQKIHAHGCTSNAACLWPYYKAKKVVDTIVMVTDEYENTVCHGYYFADLLAKYRKEVNPNVVLVVVRVGMGSKDFQNSLERNGFKAKVVSIDNGRPDLTKFDGLVGQIAAASQATTRATEKSEGDTDVSTEDEDFVMVDV